MQEIEMDAGMRAAYLSSYGGSRLTCAVLLETVHELKVTVALLLM
jgi:hypothetical protein